jgi:hypothetical protein
MVQQASGKKIKIQDTSSLMSKLSDSRKYELGYFIKKEKAGKSFVYTLVKEALNLAPEQLYDLSRKTGKSRFTLDEAIKQDPRLKKYVKGAKSKDASKKADATPEKKESSAKQPEGLEDVKRALEELSTMIKDQGGLKVNVSLNIRLMAGNG